VGVLDAARGVAATFAGASDTGAVATVGMPAGVDALALASDPFVLDACRASGPLARTDLTVLNERARSAAGVALSTARGEVLGILLVLDREARGGRAPTDEEDRYLLAEALVSRFEGCASSERSRPTPTGSARRTGPWGRAGSTRS
jgi:hypothetical protein